jgi:hypothetical protein
VPKAEGIGNVAGCTLAREPDNSALVEALGSKPSGLARERSPDVDHRRLLSFVFKHAMPQAGLCDIGVHQSLTTIALHDRHAHLPDSAATYHLE